MPVITKNLEILMKCPHCGYSEFYVKVSMRGKGQYMLQFDGSDGDNTCLHEGLSYKLGTIAKCSNCNKYLGKLM